MNQSTSLSLQGNGLSMQSLDQMSRPMKRLATREVEKVVTQALVTHTREQARAMLTTTAMQNVGTLSALEEHLIHIAPLAAPRLQALCDAYAMGAAATIMRY